MKNLFTYLYPLILIIIAFAVYIFVGPISKHYACNVYYDNLEYKYEKARAELVETIDTYIHTVAPNSVMNGSTIFQYCDEYDIDIKFVLAQGQVESHFGTKGIAVKTNSAFNVHSYDGVTADEIHKKGWSYAHPDKSVEPYIKLLKKKYLVNGKSEMDLLDNFVDANGHRYATSPTYEVALMTAMKGIDDIVPLSDKYYEYAKYKMLLYR